MNFFMTPFQRKVLTMYWKEKKPFTLYTLWEDGVVKNAKWGASSLKRMLKKSQIIGFRDSDGLIKFVGTTENETEWNWVKSTRERPLSDVSSSSNFWTAGMNKYEREKAITEYKEIIERKKKEIEQRKKDSVS